MNNNQKENLLLTIPIYLNTRVVFDMLATIEDGFSLVRNIQSSESVNDSKNAEANLGAGNIFALLNIGLKGDLSKTNISEENCTEEKTHTTVSLFQKLRTYLDDHEMIVKDSDALKVGDFFEIQGTLRTNPLIDLLSSMKELMVFANLFSDDAGKKKDKTQRKNDFLADKKMQGQIEGLINGLKVGGKVDVICETDSIKAVVLTDESYFTNNNMSELTDGNYKILGKVIRICKDRGSISLLRNTVFSKLQLENLKEFRDILNDDSIKAISGGDEMVTSIEAPALLMIPIAIYV